MVPVSFALPFCGDEFVLTRSRALFWPRENALLVADLCKPFGPVADVRVNYFQNSRESRGSATVEFLDSCSAERARESLDGYDEPGWKAPLDVDAGKTRTVEANG